MWWKSDLEILIINKPINRLSMEPNCSLEQRVPLRDLTLFCGGEICLSSSLITDDFMGARQSNAAYVHIIWC